jgi:hypothetical protein
MPRKEFNDSCEGIKKLLGDVREAEQKGSFEGMKNSFLGGMRDGESWGLRKWLSKNGGALKICNDIELIWGALRDFPREDASIKELAKILRPKAKNALKRLQDGVPKAYQERSTAHPYLPFFHRLECALKGLSAFDPEDDDVICLIDSDDDDEVEEVKATTKPLKSKKGMHDKNNGAESEHKWGNRDENDSQDDVALGASHVNSSVLRTASAVQLAQSIDGIATMMESGHEIRPPNINFEEYWTRPHNYILVLRLFQKIILENTTGHLIDHVSETPKYFSLIKNPLCFRDIVIVLSENEMKNGKKIGQLRGPSLKRWNIFEGRYLIQAVDLVFLNHLAFLGKNPNMTRKLIQALRLTFWREIRKAASTEKKCVPTRRTETSEFVIYKK